MKGVFISMMNMHNVFSNKYSLSLFVISWLSDEKETIAMMDLPACGPSEILNLFN